MNSKKIVTMLVAGITALSGVLITATGCDTGCKHPDVNYAVVKPATCAEQGEESGNCPDCGETVTRSIPVNPDNHVYGDWQVTKPTDSAKGSATNRCTFDGTATTVELPAITRDDEGYATEITVAPKALHEGEKKYTYANDIKDITFTMPMPARGVSTVADGVEAALETMDKVRSGEGRFGWMRYNMLNQIDGDDAGGKYTNVTYEFGDNYTHSFEDGGRTEKWCSLGEDGDYFAFSREGNNDIIREQNRGFMNGPMISLTGLMIHGYGAHGFLHDLYYNMAITNDNKDFEERYNPQTGEYFFKFGFISRETEAMNTFAKIEVTFTLTDEYTLDTLDIVSNGYVNIPTLEEDRKPVDPITGERIEVKTWDYIFDANNNPIATLVVPEYTGHRMYETVHLEHKTVTQANADGDPVPEMPYKKDEIMIQSFNLYRGSQLLDGEEPLTITADDSVNLRIGDVVPSTVNYRFDTLRAYLIGENGEETLLGSDTINTAHYNGYFNAESGTITLRSQLAGDATIKIASAYAEKIIKVHTNPVLPSRLLPSVREYEEDQYVWRNSSTTTIQTQVCVGQPLWFKVSPPEEEISYAEGGYTTRFINSDGQEIELDTAALTEETVDGMQTRKFVATAPGQYTVQFRSVAGMRGGTVRITVVEIPDVREQLSGEYSAVVKYPSNGRVTVEFTLNGDGTGTAIVNETRGRERLDFEYTQTPTGLTLTSRHGGFADLGYVLSFNEAWRLVLSHPTGFEDDVETVVLLRTPAE